MRGRFSTNADREWCGGPCLETDSRDERTNTGRNRNVLVPPIPGSGTAINAGRGDAVMTRNATRPVFALLSWFCHQFLMAQPGYAPAEIPVPRGYLCVYTRSPIVIDANLNDRPWKDAPWSETFLDIEGTVKPEPRYRTRMKMLWDDSYLYIGAELEEPHVWGTLTKRDTVIFYDNDFEVFIDPDGDNHEYYELEMNVLNTVWDLLLKKPYRDGGPPVDAWNIQGLKSAVHVDGTLNNPADTDRGWSVEIAMPWSALREYAHRATPPEEGDQWRINFSRVEWDREAVDGQYRKVKGRPEHNWVWSPQGIIDMHRPEFWGYVQFTRTSGQEAHIRPDSSAPARNLLLQIYYAQRRFHDTFKRWASSVDELPMSLLPANEQLLAPLLESAADGFLASVTIRHRNGKTERWHIRQDSRLWAE
jgi:hypothetical protein